jgi:CRP/FNR family transcriptional regulator, cyclic AMP receptor protein
MDQVWYAAPSDFWGNLTPTVRAELDLLGTRARFRKGNLVFRAGSDGHDVYVLMSGRVKVYALSPQGRAVTLWFCLPGEVFGLAEMARNSPRMVYAEACTNAEVLILPCDQLRARLEIDAATAMQVVDMLSCRLRQLSDAMLNLIADDVNTRVAKLLLRLHARYGRPLDSGGFLLDLPLTHQEMADMIGTTRQSVSSAVAQLRQRGLLTTTDHRLCLTDPERLAKTTMAAQPGLHAVDGRTHESNFRLGS